MGNSELVKVENGALAGFNPDQVNVIKNTVAKGVTDNELLLFLHVCQRTGLDPFSKQIYAIVRRDHGQPKMVIQTGIDGYRSIADRQSNYAGSDEPLFDERLTEFQMRNLKRAHPQTATCTVYKVVGGVRCPFTATASWDSYCPPQGQDSMWRKFPFLMLAKCAEALALRKGWAAQMSGVYTDAEMQQAGGFVEVEDGAMISHGELGHVKRLSAAASMAGDMASDAIEGEIMALASDSTLYKRQQAQMQARSEEIPASAYVHAENSISEPSVRRMQRTEQPQGDWVDFTVESVDDSKRGEGKKGPWTRYKLTGTVDDRLTTASTFEGAIMQYLETLPATIRVLLAQGSYGLDIKDFGPAGELSGDIFDVGDLGPPLEGFDSIYASDPGPVSPGD